MENVWRASIPPCSAGNLRSKTVGLEKARSGLEQNSYDSCVRMRAQRGNCKSGPMEGFALCA